MFLIGSQLNNFGQDATRPEVLETSAFVNAVENNQVTEVKYSAATHTVTGYFL